MLNVYARSYVIINFVDHNLLISAYSENCQNIGLGLTPMGNSESAPLIILKKILLLCAVVSFSQNFHFNVFKESETIQLFCKLQQELVKDFNCLLV